jgi:uncharacterized protein (DUF111 family)
MVSDYGPPPAMTIRRIGYGAGQRDLAEQSNLLRVLIGEAGETGTDDGDSNEKEPSGRDAHRLMSAE